VDGVGRGGDCVVEAYDVMDVSATSSHRYIDISRHEFGGKQRRTRRRRSTVTVQTDRDEQDARNVGRVGNVTTMSAPYLSRRPRNLGSAVST
jgi:hypothetical protein